MSEITSPANTQFRLALSLTQSKGLKEEGHFLLSGKDLTQEFLGNNRSHTIEAELVYPGGTALSQARPIFLAKKLFEQIDILGTHSNILILKAPEIPTWDVKTLKPGLNIIIPVGDPGNLGACLRSAMAFGASQVILTKEAAHPFLPKSIKASAGSAYRLPLTKGPSLQELPSNILHQTIALAATGKSISQHKWDQTVCLLLGEEGPGIGNLLPGKLISIPTQQIESLNATVAMSIACFHYRSQWPL